jgi:hypothetical protein
LLPHRDKLHLKPHSWYKKVARFIRICYDTC